MADEKNLQEELLNRVKEKQKAIREKKFKKGLDDTISFVTAPYKKVKEFIEEKESAFESEMRFQARKQEEFERYLALFDESKIGTYEKELQDFGSTTKTIVHTDIGPIIEYEQKGATSRLSYMGFFPTQIGKTDYEFLSIREEMYLEYRFRDYEPTGIWISGYKRDKNGKFVSIDSEWRDGQKHSKELIRDLRRIETASRIFKNEKSKSVEFKPNSDVEMETN